MSPLPFAFLEAGSSKSLFGSREQQNALLKSLKSPCFSFTFPQIFATFGHHLALCNAANNPLAYRPPLAGTSDR